MNTPHSDKWLTIVPAFLLLILTATICEAQTFSLTLPNRVAPNLPVARVMVTLELTNAPVPGSDNLNVPGGTKNLTGTPVPSTIGGNRVLYYRGPVSSNTAIIDIELRSLLNPATLCEPLAAGTFPTTLSLTANFPGGNTITGYRMNSYSALSTNQCTCLRRRLDDPGATWLSPPAGATDRGRHPLDVVLVLDRSGSMSDPVPAGLAGSASEVKMTVLRTAVKQFIDAWVMEPNAPQDDRIAIMWFESAVTTTPPGFVRRGADGAASWGPLKTAVDLQTTGNNTAMGDGLSQGVDLYEDEKAAGLTTNDATIVLMTNGMQNEGTLIQPNNCNLSLCQFNHLNAPAGLQPIKEVCIPVLTIGVGAPGDTPTDILNGIAQQTAGVNFQAVNAVAIANAFGATLVEMLKGNTMSIHTRTEGVLNSGSSSVTPAATFRLDGSVARAIVVLGWTGAGNQNALRLELTKPPSGPPNAIAGQVNDSFYTIQAVDIPAGGPTGDWRANVVRNTGTASVPYYISVYTIEAQFGSRLDFKQSKFGTGDDIVLTAALHFGNQPLLNQGNGLEVRVERPESALNTALHKLNVSSAVLSTPPAGVNPDSYKSPYERKLFNLLQNTTLGKDIEPKPDPTIFRLLDNGNPDNGDAVAGDGIYSMRYTRTQLPGRYRFKVAMILTTPGGAVNRIEQRDLEVNVTKIDPNQSEVAATKDLITGNFRIDIVPADRFGNFLGPGYPQQIQVSLIGGGTPSAIVDERENGTYTTLVSGVSPGTNPTLKVSFLGDEFANLTLKDAQTPKRRFAVFGGIGGNFPHGDFDTFFDSGFSSQLGFEYRFTNRFSAEGTFGFDKFGFSFGSSNLDLYRLSANAKFYPVIGTFQFGVFAGGGVYHFNPASTHGGLNVGAVGEYRINTSWSVESTYNFHNVFTSGSNTRFSTLQGGVRFRF
jgi:von Willebrand factor type A domain-containing protein